MALKERIHSCKVRLSVGVLAASGCNWLVGALMAVAVTASCCSSEHFKDKSPSGYPISGATIAASMAVLDTKPDLVLPTCL